MAQNEKIGGIEFEAEIDLKKFHADTKKLQQLVEKMDPSLKKTEKGFKDVEKSTRDAGKAADKSGLSFKKLFGAFTLGNIASSAIMRALRGIKNAFFGAIRGAIDFQAQMVQVRKVTGATRSEVRDLKKFIAELGVETGIAKAELADIAAGGGRLGIFAREGAAGLQEFTRVIALSRIAMEDYAMSSEEASDKTARLLNLFGLESRDAEVLLSIMNELSNTAAATSSNIADNVTNFASLSQSFGASKESLLALATTMEEVGSEPQAFSTGFQTAIIEMQKNTDKFARFLGTDMGPKFKEVFVKEPVEAFAIFLEGLRQTGRDIGPTLESLGIGDRRLTRELSKLATDKGLQRFAANLKTAKEASREAQEAVDGLGDSASSLQAEFDRAADTTRKRMSSLGIATRNLGNAFGEKLQPALDVAIEGLTIGFEKALPFIGAVSGAIGRLIESVIVLGASVTDTIGRFRDFSAGLLRKPFEMLGFAESGAADRLMREGLESGGLGSRLAKRFAEAHKIVEESSRRTEEGATHPSVTGEAPEIGGVDTAEDAKKLTKELEKVKKAQQEIAEARDKALKQRREVLKEVLELRKDTVGLTEREERILKRIGDETGAAFDIRRAQNFTDLLDAMGDQTKELQDGFSDVTKEVDSLGGELEDMTEQSVKRLEDLTQQAIKLREEFESRFGEEGSERIEFARDIAEQIVEARKTIDELEGKGKLDASEIDRLLEAKKVFQEGQKFLTAGSEFDPKVVEFVKELDKLSNAKDVFERLEIQFEAEKERAEEALKQKEREIELSRELELAFQEERLEEFLKANEEELSEAQRRHAEELRDKRQKLQTELELNRQLQLDITNALVGQVAIRNEAQEAFKNAEVARFEIIKQKAMEAIAAIKSAQAASRSVGAAGFAGGGLVFGPGGPTDDKVPAMLSSGEFVVRAVAVKAYQPLLEAINSMKFPPLRHFEQGGPVTNNTNNARSLKLTQHFHGDSSKVMGSPRMIRWHARKAF